MLEIHQPLPPDEARTVQQAIEKIRFSDKEHLYVFKNGKQKRHFIGTSNNLHFESKYLIEVNNSTLVHNHLNDSSFSLEDILAVVELNAFNFFLVTPNFFFNLLDQTKYGELK